MNKISFFEQMASLSLVLDIWLKNILFNHLLDKLILPHLLIFQNIGDLDVICMFLVKDIIKVLLLLNLKK